MPWPLALGRSTAANAATYDFETIRPDLQALADYGTANPTDWRGAEVLDTQPAQIEVWFSANVAAHDTALKALVMHPDRVHVMPARYTVEELQAISTTVSADATRSRSGLFTTTPGGPVTAEAHDVRFGLAPGQEKLAARYLAEWGDAVSIEVGSQAFIPDGCGPQPTPRTCADIAPTDPSSGGLSLVVRLTTPSIDQSQGGTGTVVITNISSKAIELDIDDPVLGVLLSPGTDRVAATYGGGSTLGLSIVKLSPGESKTMELEFDASRCDGGVGSALPPGTYGLRAEVHAADPVTRSTMLYYSSEMPVTITPAP